MDDYINRNKFIMRLADIRLTLAPDDRTNPEDVPYFRARYEGLSDAICEATDFPAADVAPVRHGKWVTPTIINGRSFRVPHCSACDGVPCGVDEHTKYCPNCGAKMQMEGEDDG